MAESCGAKIDRHAALDEETITTLQRWHCLPGVYVDVYVPISFTFQW